MELAEIRALEPGNDRVRALSEKFVGEMLLMAAGGKDDALSDVEIMSVAATVLISLIESQIIEDDLALGTIHMISERLAGEHDRRCQPCAERLPS